MFDSFLVVGSINIDYNVRVPHLPNPGETLTGKSFSRTFGGKGANQAVSLARLLRESKEKVFFAGKVGTDDDGKNARENLKINGVSTQFISNSENHTGMALIEIDDVANNRIVVVPGANGDCDENWAVATIQNYCKLKPSIKTCFLFQLEIPIASVEAAIRTAKDSGGTIILDPAPAVPIEKKLWSLIDVVTPNQSEAQLYTGVFPKTNDSAQKAALKFAHMGTQAVIIKAGAIGSWYFDEKEQWFCPAFTVNALDTTAAGDVFNAAFAAARGKDMSASDSLRFANAAAAISITGEGAQSAMPGYDTVEELLQAQPKIVPRQL